MRVKIAKFHLVDEKHVYLVLIKESALPNTGWTNLRIFDNLLA